MILYFSLVGFPTDESYIKLHELPAREEQDLEESLNLNYDETDPNASIAIELAREVFLQTHTEEIVMMHVEKSYMFFWYDAEEDAIKGHDSNSTYIVSFHYLKNLTYPEGEVTVWHGITYDVEVESKKVAQWVNTATKTMFDDPAGFILRFEGTAPIASKEEANQTFLWLLEKSPWGKRFPLQHPPYSPCRVMFSSGLLHPETSNETCEETHISPITIEEAPDHYRVKGYCRNTMVNTPYAYTRLIYDIYKNGTAEMIAPTMENQINGRFSFKAKSVLCAQKKAKAKVEHLLLKSQATQRIKRHAN